MKFRIRPLTRPDVKTLNSIRKATKESEWSPYRIYILGIGNLGQYVAYSLKKHHLEAPLRIIIPSARVLKKFQDKPRIEYTHYDGWTRTQSRDISSQELLSADPKMKRLREKQNMINLIVSTHPSKTKDAIAPLIHLLGKKSEVLFLHQGFSVVDEVLKLFPDPGKRPRFWTSLCRAHITSTPAKDPFRICHEKPGTLEVGLIYPNDSKAEGAGGLAKAEGDRISQIDEKPGNQEQQDPEREKNQEEDPERENNQEEDQDAGDNDGKQPISDNKESQYPHMIRTLLSTPTLEAKIIPSKLLYLHQLEKLAVQAVLHGAAGMFGCTIGQLRATAERQRVLKLIFQEVAQVMQALLPPPPKEGAREWTMLSKARRRLEPKSLHAVISEEMDKQENNWSLLQKWRPVKPNERDPNLKKNYPTELNNGLSLEAVNGYIVKKGKELGIEVVNNEMMLELLRSGRTLRYKQADRHFYVRKDWVKTGKLETSLDLPPKDWKGTQWSWG